MYNAIYLFTILIWGYVILFGAHIWASLTLNVHPLKNEIIADQRIHSDPTYVPKPISNIEVGLRVAFVLSSKSDMVYYEALGNVFKSFNCTLTVVCPSCKHKYFVSKDKNLFDVVFVFNLEVLGYLKYDDSYYKIDADSMLNEFYENGGNVFYVNNENTYGYNGLNFLTSVGLKTSFLNDYYMYDQFSESGNSTEHLYNPFLFNRNFFEELSDEDFPKTYSGSAFVKVEKGRNLFSIMSASNTSYLATKEDSSYFGYGHLLCVICGSQYFKINSRALFFSSSKFVENEFVNSHINFMTSLIEWIIHVSHVIHVEKMELKTLETIDELRHTVNDFVQYDLTLWEMKHGKWLPFTNQTDLLINLYLMKPVVVQRLIENPDQPGQYFSRFHLPNFHGTFRAFFTYLRSPYSHVYHEQTIAIHPERVSLLPRFLISTFPYYFGIFSTFIASLIVICLLIFHRPEFFTKKLKEN